MNTPTVRALPNPLNRLASALKKAKVRYSQIETTAPKAPWNHTGKRVWFVWTRGYQVSATSIPAVVKEAKAMQNAPRKLAAAA